MRLLKMLIKKMLGIASPSLQILGYKYEWDYYWAKRRENEQKAAGHRGPDQPV